MVYLSDHIKRTRLKVSFVRNIKRIRRKAGEKICSINIFHTNRNGGDNRYQPMC